MKRKRFNGTAVAIIAVVWFVIVVANLGWVIDKAASGNLKPLVGCGVGWLVGIVTVGILAIARKP